MRALSYLQHRSGIIRAGLVSNHLRVITPHDFDTGKLEIELSQEGVPAASVAQVEPSLEDVFLALASRS
jgi:hypothetical protein